MSPKLLYSLVLAVALAAAVGWWLAMSDAKPAHWTAPAVSTAPTKPAGKVATNPGWTPPTGEPVDRYREAKTSQERYDMIANFMALGHDRNVNMLIAAVADSDPKIRHFAVESAASALTPELACQVYQASGKSPDAELREMTWSFLAPHPIENRAQVYGEILVKGPDVAIEEVLAEMGRTPETPLFETLLGSGLTEGVKPERVTRIVKELNEWLKPGGGEVPVFTSASDLAKWWAANKQHYDTFMLRID